MSGDDAKGGSGSGGFDEGDATVQMEPDAIAELHRRLAAIGETKAAPPREPQPGTLQPPARKPAAAPVAPPAPVAAPAPAPVAPPVPAPAPVAAPAPAPVAPSAPAPVAAPAPAPVAPSAPAPVAPPAPAKPAVAATKTPSSGGGALVAGGIGAVLLAIVAVLGLPEVARELPREEAVKYAIGGAAILGWALVASALAAASRRTNGVAGVAAVFAFLAVIGKVLELALIPELRGDDRQVVAVIVFFLPWASWALMGAWALAATRALGGLGAVLGIVAVITATAGVAVGVLVLARLGGSAPGDVRDVVEVLGYTMFGGSFLASALLTGAFLGPLRRAVRP